MKTRTEYQVKTRTEYQRDLDHMLDNVWRVEKDSTLALLLRTKKIRLVNVMKLDIPHLEALQCNITSEGATTTITLEPWDIGKIRTLCGYIHHKQDTFDDDISSIDVEDY